MNTQVKYTGTALPTDSNTATLFTTVDGQLPRRFFGLNCYESFLVDIKHSHGGTLRAQKSDDGGTNWHTIREDVLAAGSPTNGSTAQAYGVAPYRDWRLVWVNGGTTQTTFEIDMSLSDQAQ